MLIDVNYKPSALISVGPQAQMEDDGKFASARTEKRKTNTKSVNVAAGKSSRDQSCSVTCHTALLT